MDLPLCNGHNAIFTYVDQLIKYFRLIYCFLGEGGLSTSSVARLFFDNIVLFFGIPSEATSEGEPRFTASFW